MRWRMNEPRELVYFTDRDLGKRFPEKLRAGGVRVERHDDHFGQLTPDPEWIGEIGRRGWVAVTRDSRIRYSPLLRKESQPFIGKIRRDTVEVWLRSKDRRE